MFNFGACRSTSNKNVPPFLQQTSSAKKTSNQKGRKETEFNFQKNTSPQIFSFFGMNENNDSDVFSAQEKESMLIAQLGNSPQYSAPSPDEAEFPFEQIKENVNIPARAETRFLSIASEDQNVCDVINTQCSEVQNETVVPSQRSPWPSNAKQIDTDLPLENHSQNEDLVKEEKEFTLSGSNADVEEDFQIVYSRLQIIFKENEEVKEKFKAEVLSLELYKREMCDLEAKCNESVLTYEKEVGKREEIASKFQQLQLYSETVEEDILQINNCLEGASAIVNSYEDWNEQKRVELNDNVKSFKILEDMEMKYQQLKNEALSKKACWNKEIEDLEKSNEDLKIKLKEATEKLNEQNNQFDILEQAIDSWKLSNTKISEDIKIVEQTIKEKTCEFDEQYKQLETENNSLQTEVLELKITEALRDVLKEEFVELEGKEKAVDEEIKAVHEQCSGLEKEVVEPMEEEKILAGQKVEANEKANKLKDLLFEKEAKLSEEKAAQEILKREYEDYCKEHDSLRQEMDILENQRDTYVDNIKTAEEEIENLEKNTNLLKELQKELCEKIEELEREVQEKEEDNTLLKEKIERSKSDFSCLTVASNEKQADLTTKRQNIAALELELSKVQSDLSATEERTKSYENEITKSEEDCANKRKDLMSSIEVYRQKFAIDLKGIENVREEIEKKNKSLEEELENVKNMKFKGDEERVKLLQILPEKRRTLSSLQTAGKKLLQALSNAQKKAKTCGKKSEEMEELQNQIAVLKKETASFEAKDIELEMLQEDIRLLQTQRWTIQIQNTKYREEADEDGILSPKVKTTLSVPKHFRKRTFDDDEDILLNWDSDLDIPQPMDEDKENGIPGKKENKQKKGNDKLPAGPSGKKRSLSSFSGLNMNV